MASMAYIVTSMAYMAYMVYMAYTDVATRRCYVLSRSSAYSSCVRVP